MSNAVVSLASELVKKTRKGRVQDWAERISVVALKADLPLEDIAWNRAPLTVAIDVVHCAQRYRRLDQLKTAMGSYQEE